MLEAAQVPCWIAPRDIPPGSQYIQAILDGLAAAPALVLLFSRAANDSPHVRRELETAIGTDTALFPVRLDDLEPSPSLRYYIGAAQWLDTVGVSTETWEAALVAGVQRLLGIPVLVHPHAPPSTPVGVPESPTAQPRLPRPPGTTWGRQAVCAEVAELLDEGNERLVTLTGLGGIGKTRVAAEVSPTVPEVDVLDNADPAAVHGHLTRTPTARVLATSRLPLGIPGERVVAVPPLDAESSLALFRDAAQRTAPSFDLDAHAEEVADLCGLLGGLPLGLTLAAARLRVVGLDRLRSGLSSNLDLVAALGESLQWSLDRLDVEERNLVERLAVYEGPVTLDAVEAVAAGPDTVDSLTALVEAGLVRVDETSDELRYALPHPVRLLARRGLEGGDQVEKVHEAAAAYLLERTSHWLGQLDTAAGPDVLAAFAASSRDVEAAVDCALLEGRTDTAVDLVLAAEGLWIATGRIGEAQARCERVLEQLPGDSPRAARLHGSLGRLAYHLNQWPTAGAELRTAVTLGEQTGDPVAVAAARCYLAGTLLMSGHVDEGRKLAVQAYAATEALGLYPQVAEALSMLAISHGIAGELVAERETHERRLDVVRRRGDIARTADALNTLAEIALDEEDSAKARRYAAESLALAADRLPLERRDAIITLARASVALGEGPEAGRLLGDALAASGEIGQSLATAQCLRVGGVLAENGGEPALAVRLFAAAQALSPAPTGTDEPPERDLSAALARARAALDEQEFEREWTIGGALPLVTMLTQLDEAIRLVGS